MNTFYDFIIIVERVFNNISVISWRSVLLVAETGVPRKKTPTCGKWLTNLMLYRVHLAMNW